ncbi:MAG: hypothetical protein JXR05_10420 [Flavobacteriaceae bacterium]
MKDTSITIKYFFSAIAAVLVTWFIHEFAHWATSEALGYETIMRLNSATPVKGQNVSKAHHIITSAAGPLITILQAIILFFFLKKSWNKFLYLFLFIPFYMRLLAGLFNVFNPNDEGRISEYYGLGLYTLPIVVSLSLFILVFKISKQYQLPKKFHLITYLIATFLITILILSDQYFKIRIF